MKSKRLLKDYSSTLSYVIRVSDLLVVVLTGTLAYSLPEWPAPLDERLYQVAVVIGALLAAVVFPMFGIYRSWRGHSRLMQLRSVTTAWLAVTMLLVVIAFLTKTSALYSRVWMMLWGTFGLVSLYLIRMALGRALHFIRDKGWNQKRVIVVGAGGLGRQAAIHLNNTSGSGFQVFGFLDDNVELHGRQIDDLEVMGGIERLVSLVDENDIDEVWIALPMRAEKRLREILHDLRHSTAAIRFVPDIFNLQLINHSISEIAGLPVLNLSESPMYGINGVVKFLEDKIIATVILVFVSPLMFLLAIGVKLSSPGPVFYRQERVSWNGKPFLMLKFRSMPVDVESTTGPVWAKQGENRATGFGAFLRKTSLDELPQFINVLAGDMSIVGPRPERPVFVQKFKDEIPDYMKKHLVKAGITGWAQVNGWRGNTDLKNRIDYDLQYIENWSLWLDLKIIFLTVFRGFSDKNAY